MSMAPKRKRTGNCGKASPYSRTTTLVQTLWDLEVFNPDAPNLFRALAGPLAIGRLSDAYPTLIRRLSDGCLGTGDHEGPVSDKQAGPSLGGPRTRPTSVWEYAFLNFPHMNRHDLTRTRETIQMHTTHTHTHSFGRLLVSVFWNVFCTCPCLFQYFHLLNPIVFASAGLTKKEPITTGHIVSFFARGRMRKWR